MMLFEFINNIFTLLFVISGVIVIQILIVTALISVIAKVMISKTYSKYSRISIDEGYNGYEIARMLLDEAELEDVKIEMIGSEVGEYYDPDARILRLPRIVYTEHSIASVGIAIHEAGHAIQHKNSVLPTMVIAIIARSSNVIAYIGLTLACVGVLVPYTKLAGYGSIILIGVLLFQVISLPIEFNASNRALAVLERRGILKSNELIPVRRVLYAASFTFVSQMMRPIITFVNKVFTIKNAADFFNGSNHS